MKKKKSIFEKLDETFSPTCRLLRIVIMFAGMVLALDYMKYHALAWILLIVGMYDLFPIIIYNFRNNQENQK